jgi:multiple antibiotic resistance protein
VVALIIWVTYAFADRLTAMLGRSKAQVVTRLAAFLLLCVGTQIAMNGVADFVRSL